MRYSRKQRREIANAFRDAYQEIEQYDEVYICHALTNSAAIHIIETRMGKTQGGWVRRPCGERKRAMLYSLDDWLYDRGFSRRKLDSGNMREYRLRWLDALIKEFSE